MVHIDLEFLSFFLSLSPVTVPCVSLNAVGSNLSNRGSDLLSQITFSEICAFFFFLFHILFISFFIFIDMTNWTKYAPPCHIIGLKYCFCTCVCCFYSSYFKQLNKKYPVAYLWQPYISASTFST